MEREGFVFKKSWRDVLTGLPDQVRMEVYDAVIEYGLSGKLSDLKHRADVAFRFIKQDIDSAMNNGTETDAQQGKVKDRRSITSRENGKKGGRKPKQKPKEPILNLGFPDENSSLSRAHVIRDNNKNNNQDIKEKNIKEEKKESVEKETKKMQIRKDAFQKELEPFIPVYGKEMVDMFFSYWSEANTSQKKMRWELQKTWETPRRLKTWAAREDSFSGNKYYGNSQLIDPRRGTPATHHRADEY